LAFLFVFEEINALTRQLNPEKTSSSKKKKTESLLPSEIDVAIQPIVVMKVRTRFTFVISLSHLVLAKLS
jgi:hypothetical protein